MNGTEADLQSYVRDFREKFKTLPFNEIAKPSGVKGLDKYYDKNDIWKSGTPVHVKGSLVFNNVIKQRGMKNVLPIGDGDKIRYVYLKQPNPMHCNVISMPEELPTEFGLDKYVDVDMMFEKTFLDAVSSITEIIDWDIEPRSTIESFFG
jgi:hypothetical protein